MVLGEDGLTLLNVHRYMKQIFFSVISEDILNFFPSQMLYWVLETCLICSPTINRNNKQKNFIRFGSSSVWLFSYHQCFCTYETFEHYVPIVKVFLSHCRSFLSNCDSLYVRLNSHYKAWSYKKKKDKKKREVEPVELVQMNIYLSNTDRKGLTWLHFGDEPRVQER